MLTKTDLKSIEKVIDNRLDVKLDEKFDIKLKPITKRLINLERITTETQKDVRRLRKDLKTTSNTLDKENLKLAKRLTAIEVHLGLPQPAIA